MITTTYIVIVFVLLGLYSLMSYLSYLKTKPKLEEVEAGPTGSMTMGKSRDYKVSPLRPQDKLMNCDSAQSYKQFVVKGACMEARNIFEGDIILIEPFKDNLSDDDKMSLIHENDILLIYLNDEKFRGHKIRVFSGKQEKEELNTFYYNKDGSIHDSNSPHQLKDIKGIVRMKLD